MKVQRVLWAGFLHIWNRIPAVAFSVRRQQGIRLVGQDGNSCAEIKEESVG